jgi:succinate dehydrogenase / fumarate reductase, cytochrome b subunit
VNSKRPVNLDLTKFHFPLPAITSILHRVTGVIIFIAMAFLLWGLDLSLESEQSFSQLQVIMDGFFAKLILWGILAGLAYHFVAGIKHLVMDAGFAEDLESAMLAAKVVIGVAVFLTLLAGVWVW